MVKTDHDRHDTPAPAAMTGRALLSYGLVGGVMVGLFIALRYLSFAIATSSPPAHRSIFLLVALSAGAGGIYWLTIALARSWPRGRATMMAVFAVGLLMRLLMFSTAPMLEDDHYRYLWDGAVVASGHNPYRYSPDDVRGRGTRPAPIELRDLADESGQVIHNINHRDLRTIYPPVTQALFALGYLIKPFSLDALRGVWLGLDLATLILLAATLRALRLPLGQLAIYWCNPLLVMEIYNRGHMELAAIVFAAAALLVLTTARPLPGVSLLAIAVGAKVWPVVLLPLALRRHIARPVGLLAAIVLFFCLVGIFAWPMLADDFGRQSGSAEYARGWEMNDGLYLLPLWLAEAANLPHPHLIARTIVGGILLVVIALCVRRPVTDGIQVFDRALIIVTTLFMLSPTQFPWYFVWLLPILTIRPRASLLLLTALLPLYYLRFYFEQTGTPDVSIYDNGLVWLQYAPVIVLLILEWVGVVRWPRALTLPR